MVDDDDMTEDEGSDDRMSCEDMSDDVTDNCLLPNAGAGSLQPPVPTRPYTFAGKIRNTILLAGPPGSGKTAAIYACAEELGWEVFEVYPGIGKRGGTNLDALVGDIGKNHLVHSSRSRPGPLSPAKPKRHPFVPSGDIPENNSSLRHLHRRQDADEGAKMAETIVKEEQTIGQSSEGIFELALMSQVSQCSSTCSEQSFGQSIVLFEEVDVLFKDEAGFWSALINFIKDCKRPVVLTCNGIPL